ncbi:MACPF domain-containing protein [Trichonephila clavipes]|nr:MACPF domain-containing protein [Trichonephila clavipes]
MTWFHSTAAQFPRARHHSKRRRRWVGVTGSTRNGRRDPKCPSARRLWFVREDTGVLSEGLPVPGWRPMKQLAARMLFLRCGGLLDDCSVEGVLSLSAVLFSAKLEKLQKEAQDSASMEINYYATVPIEGVSYTTDGLIKLVEEFPNHVKKINNGLGNPLRMEMVPLRALQGDYAEYLENR